MESTVQDVKAATAETLNKMIDLQGAGFDFEAFALKYGFKILGSIIIIVLALILMNFVGKILKIALMKVSTDETLTNFLVKLSKIIILVVGILAALNNIGVDTTSFVALFTATSFAISFAFKETLSNIAAGVLVIVFRPFKIGDYVKFGAVEGFVADISLFSVTLRMHDNTNIIVPNSQVISNSIYNYSREKVRRIDYSKTIEPSALCELRKEIENTLGSNELILKDPAIFVGVKSVNDTNIEVSVQMWVKNENYERASMLINEAMTKVFIK